MNAPRGLSALLLLAIPIVVVACVVMFDGRPVPQQSLQDLGRLLRGEEAVATFVLRNDGLRALSITEVRADCGSYAGVSVGAILKSGQTISIPVSLVTSRLREGEAYSKVVIRTSSWFRSALTLVVRTEVRSEFTLSSHHLQFPSRGGHAELVVSGTSESLATPLSVVSTHPDIHAKLGAVESGNTRQFVVKAEWRPTSSPLWDLGNLVIHTNSAAAPEIRIPVRRGPDR